MHKTPLAWLNLCHNRFRTGVAIAGVAFALILIFMQLGFLETVSSTATVTYDSMDFDLCIRSVDYLHFVESRSFDHQRLQVVRGVTGVAEAVPFYIAIRPWRTPEGQPPKRLGILTMAYPRGERVFRPSIHRAAARGLNVPNVVLIDQESRAEFGPANGQQFSAADVGMRVEVGHRSFYINGTFQMGTGLSANGAALMNAAGFERATAPRSINQVSLGLVRLVRGMPPSDILKIRDEISSRLPKDVEVLTRAEVLTKERNRWVKETSFGLIFQLGVIVALVVGVAVVYQVLASDVASLLPEYATLKAMGYSNGYLGGVVLKQALALAFLGFAPGVLISLGLYRLTTWLAHIPIEMTSYNFFLVLGLSVLMCALSGVGVVRKVFAADPADLF
jgi:putative ABC transport system permease protein